MSKRSDKTKDPSPQEDQHTYSTTLEISRDAFTREMATKQRAYLEIIGTGEKKQVIELEERDILIGRSHECDIRLPADNVSRKHARVTFHNEEYHITDLDNTNGTYVNGIEIVKCVLRNHDQIEIGGVKLLFNEEKTLQQA